MRGSQLECWLRKSKMPWRDLGIDVVGGFFTAIKTVRASITAGTSVCGGLRSRPGVRRLTTTR